MPRIDQIDTHGPDVVKIPELPWLEGALGGGFIRGGIYLLAGEPGTAARS
jgi:predicted ATP-dependent serine protease